MAFHWIALHSLIVTLERNQQLLTLPQTLIIQTLVLAVISKRLRPCNQGHSTINKSGNVVVGRKKLYKSWYELVLAVT
jgi:hypothetical protein